MKFNQLVAELLPGMRCAGTRARGAADAPNPRLRPKDR